jgi:hypothetical protein
MHEGVYDPIVPPPTPLISIIRDKRDKLLTATDWTQVTDSPLTDENKEEWREYRQKLRDITKDEDLSLQMFPESPQIINKN